MEEALWVEYKKSPTQEAEYSPGDTGKMQETFIYLFIFYW
jgi:hypothetical protein